MRSFTNLEKSGFCKGEYIGYGGGKVWRIAKSNSSYGNWCAHAQNEPNNYFFAWRLVDMSAKLTALDTPLGLLRHHVTGAIERGEAQAIVEIR